MASFKLISRWTIRLFLDKYFFALLVLFVQFYQDLSLGVPAAQELYYHPIRQLSTLFNSFLKLAH